MLIDAFEEQYLFFFVVVANCIAIQKVWIESW